MPETPAMHRRGQGYKPRLTFTSDFHELVVGDLIPGPCNLRYDPLRIVPRNEVGPLPKTQRPVIAHLRYHPSGQLVEIEMRFRPAEWLSVDEDPTGDGTMLQARFDLPQGCRELECWFSYVGDDGQTRWDSAMGANYWLRFSTFDLQIAQATIAARPDRPLDLFELEVRSVLEVTAIDVRWRYTNTINDARYQRPLAVTLLDGNRNWSLDGGAEVASATPLAFDLVYFVDTHKYTDDNQGTWYVVSR
jgi:hypothetical protein